MEYENDPEFKALYETVRTFPEDDAPRWIIADWIEEHDDPERAAFIRDQLSGRPFDLFHKADFTKEMARRLCDQIGGHDWFRRAFTPMIDVYRDGQPWVSLVLKRGFVEEVRHLTCEAFTGLTEVKWLETTAGPQGRRCTLAEVLFKTHPIRSVVLTDKRPEQHAPPQMESNWSWYSDGFQYDPATLPTTILDLMTGWMPKLTHGGMIRRAYATETEALAACSCACVNFGRSKAGLPVMAGSGK